MMKDILVHIPVDDRAKPIIDCAVSLAQNFGAHLDGVVRIYQPFNPLFANGDMTALAVGTQIEPDVQVVESILEQFTVAARAAGISYGTKTIPAKASSFFQSATELSRLYSLVVIAQPDSQKPSYDNSLPEIVLIDCGRPLLLIPYIHRGPLKLRRILICWDGGSPAARAVHDAMPFLYKATTIDVVTVGGGDVMDENSPEALKAHLARRGLSADILRLPSNTTSIYDTILSLASDCSTDLIVMGGYGHSRIREYMLGGVTRGMLETLTIPALISH
jgi:nucleotide-binding universal stress UspA family protein